jgi:hypothetical protein
MFALSSGVVEVVSELYARERVRPVMGRTETTVFAVFSGDPGLQR